MPESNVTFPAAPVELTGDEVAAVLDALLEARKTATSEERKIIQAVLDKLPDAEKA